MKFLRENQDAAVQTIAQRISYELHKGERVLWLVSGGSNVLAEAEILRVVRAQVTEQLPQLAIMPMDERYGPEGHKNSNAEQLRAAGFDPGAAVWLDVLMHNRSFEQTVDFYDKVITVALDKATVIIGQFGLGGDGHTAGILPTSPATQPVELAVIGYQWSDYQRMTLTPMALAKIQTAYVLAYGKGKKEALARLKRNNEPLSQLPAKILYDIPEVYVYNDASKSVRGNK